MTTLREAAQSARLALSVAHGALLECSPCAAPDCQATQREWLDDARREVEKATAALRAALAAEPTSTSDTSLIDAAQRYAANYDGDNRQGIRVDLLNAFYAGSRFNAAEPQEPAPQPVACRPLDQPKVGETWHILRKGATACDTKKIAQITDKTVMFEPVMYGVEGERLPLHDGLFVERAHGIGKP